MAKAPRKKKPKSASVRRSRRRQASTTASPTPLLLPATAASIVKPKAKRRRAPQPKRPPAPTPRKQLFRLGLAGAFAIFALVAATGLLTNIHTLQASSQTAGHDTNLTNQLRSLTQQISNLETAEEVTDVQVVATTALDQELSQIRNQINANKNQAAATALGQLTIELASDRAQLAGHDPVAATAVTTSATLTVPILVYHKTPSDFETQLDILEQKNYHTITMAQLAAALHGLAGLPPKPVIISFDDGFADQMDAFTLLQKHHMVAVFYIIDGGAQSRWCIGAGRRYNDPLQPASGCGDAYLNWDQVRQLDRSGIITIGSHTIDHPDLASEPAAQQQYEIAQGKQELEAQLGHPVYDFAYPYGSYSATTLAIVQQAGFTTAVTTTPGTSQSLAGIYTLERVRDPRALP